MTTLVYNKKDGEIAIDSRITQGGTIVSDSFDKTIKNEKGHWFFVGTRADFLEFSKLEKGDTASLNCEAYLVTDGRAYLVCLDKDGRCLYDELLEDDAMGSGREYALAAMDFGEGAKGAIEYAKTRDVYTGGEVRVFKMSEIA